VASSVMGFVLKQLFNVAIGEGSSLRSATQRLSEGVVNVVSPGGFEPPFSA
jgi:hypothetical protein